MTAPAPYYRYVATAALHTLDTLPRRKMTYLAMLVLAAPVIIPIALILQGDIFLRVNGEAVFARLAQFVHLNALCPLFALLFGGMLVGEDVESNTFPYILTRPIPRSAWVLGRFVGFLAGIWCLMAASILLTYLISTRLDDFDITRDSLTLLGRFGGVMALSLAAYGAISLLLGALFKHPIIIGIVVFYGWQRLAAILPGYLDLFTVEKYVSVLLPEVRGIRSAWERLLETLQIAELKVDVGPWTSVLALLGITAVFVALGAYTVRQREYTAAQAAGT